MKILISGAGIAGLTAAHWLARYGFTPTVVERAPGLRAGGNGVDLRDLATDVVRRMGILPAVRAAATDVRGIRFVDADDRTTARLDLTGASEVEIMRGDLVSLLRAETAVEYRFGDSVTHLHQDDHGVTVAFQNQKTQTFDLVLAADGLHSPVRRLAFGPDGHHLRHRGHYFAFADADAGWAEDRCVTMFNRPGKMAGVYRSGNHAQAKAYFIFRSATVDGDPRTRLREAFGDETSWHIPDLLRTALADPDLYFDAVSQVRLDRWATGRVALVGDAAWCASPASGAGAELAIVGAYRLATALAATAGDHRAAFREYQKKHGNLVRARQRVGPNLRLMVPRTDAGIRVRNTAARAVNWWARSFPPTGCSRPPAAPAPDAQPPVRAEG